MSRYDILLNPESKSPTKGQPAPGPASEAPLDSRDEPMSGRSTAESTSRPRQLSPSRLVPRPKAFYITERLDRRLDEAVRYFQTEHGVKKADRSTIVNALLDHDSIWSAEALDDLVERVLGQLTSRLTE